MLYIVAVKLCILQILKFLFLRMMEWRRCVKDILHPIIPLDPPGPQSIALAIVITKGRWKTDITKCDKSHWEHIPIVHEKIRNPVDQVQD